MECVSGYFLHPSQNPRRVKISCLTVSIETKLIGLKTNNNFISVNFLFIIFKIALQNANVEIVDVEIICIEMKWQRVCVIIKSTSAISASFSNGMRFGVFFALN